GLFQLGGTSIDTLVNALPKFDFSILVLTPDDMITTRKIDMMSPRDNVIFELGLFLARLGRERTFILRPHGGSFKVPSDLTGVTVAQYEWPRKDGNYLGAVGAACDQIRTIIQNIGPLEARAAKQLRVLEQQQAKQEHDIDVLAFLIRHLLPAGEIEILRKLTSESRFEYDMYPR